MNIKKRILVLLLLALSLVILVGCAEKEEKSIYEYKQDGIKLTFNYFHKKDIVQKQINENESSFENLNVTSAEEAKTLVDKVKDQYNAVKGVNYQADISDNKVIEKIEIDYNNLDFEAAKKIQGTKFTSENVQKVSMKKTEEVLLQMGFKKVE